jgi:hypothetical protein
VFEACWHRNVVVLLIEWYLVRDIWVLLGKWIYYMKAGVLFLLAVFAENMRILSMLEYEISLTNTNAKYL